MAGLLSIQVGDGKIFFTGFPFVNITTGSTISTTSLELNRVTDNFPIPTKMPWTTLMIIGSGALLITLAAFRIFWRGCFKKKENYNYQFAQIQTNTYSSYTENESTSS